MRTATISFLVLVALLATFGLVLAGTLDPPGPPAPTMVTLQQVYDKIGAGCDGVPKSGQSTCWNAAGATISCSGTGQDGETQLGVSVSPRFIDNGNGTVKDNLTGLIWLKNANCFGTRSWTNALADANTLAAGICGLTDGSTAGDWRLPNIKELQSLIDFGQNTPALPAGQSFSAVQNAFYWSSSTYMTFPARAWVVLLTTGDTIDGTKTNALSVWPVRSQ